MDRAEPIPFWNPPVGVPIDENTHSTLRRGCLSMTIDGASRPRPSHRAVTHQPLDSANSHQ